MIVQLQGDGDNDIQLSVDPAGVHDESLHVDNMSIEGDFIDVEALLAMTTSMNFLLRKYFDF